MPIVDANGNALPPTSEGLLEHVRRAREAKYATIAASNANTNNDNDKSIEDNPVIDRRATKKLSTDNAGNSGKGREKEDIVYRGDTSVTSIERSTNDIVGNIRSEYREPATGYSSLNQYSGTRKESISGNIADGIRKAIQPLREVLQEKVKGETKKKKAAPDAKKLNDTEAIKLRPRIIEMFSWQCEHADKFIQATTKGHNEVNIWSNLDETEIDILVDFLIGRGKVNASVAGVVRSMAELMDKIRAGTILLPRAYATVITYIQRGFSIT